MPKDAARESIPVVIVKPSTKNVDANDAKEEMPTKEDQIMGSDDVLKESKELADVVTPKHKEELRIVQY